MTAASSNPKTETIRNQVRTSYAELNQLLDGPLATLDQDKLYQVPVEGEWTIMQNLAHIVEFMPYWAGEIEKLVARPGQKFGRIMQDEGRLGAIREHANDNLEHLRASLPDSYTRLQQVLGRLTDDNLTLTGQHSKFGERPLEWFISDFVTDHLAAHIIQIKGDLASVE